MQQHIFKFRPLELVLGIRQILLFGISASLLSTATFASEESTLPTITAHANQDATTSYTVKKSRSATKLNLALKDTPQSVSVITSQQIEDANLTSVEDVLNQTPGVSMQRYGAKGAVGNGGEYTFYYARGKQIINYQVDGVMTSPSLDSKNGSVISSLDPAIYENVTVVKGATGLTNGAGYPSASVNFNRKHANSTEPKGEIKVSAGSWNTYRTQLDVQDKLNQSGSVRGRAVAVYGQGDSWQDWGDNRSATLYGIVDADLSDQTTVSVGGMLSRNKITGQGVHGLDMYGADGSINPYSPSFNSSARWAYSKVDTFNAFAQLKHQFDNNWILQANYSYTEQDIKSLYGVIGVASANYTTNVASLAASQNNFNPKEHSLDVSASGPYQLLGREHELMLGASYQYVRNNNDNFNGCDSSTDTCTVDLSTWNGNVAVPSGATRVIGVNNKEYQQVGYYAATRLNPTDRLHVILGSRLSDYTYRSHVTTTTKTTDSRMSAYAKLTPYAGITYDISPNVTAYASYTNIFMPQTYRDYNYNLLDPQEGNNYEAGLKAAFLDNRINLSAAYFQSKMDNVANSGTVYGSNIPSSLTGVVSSTSSYYSAIDGVITKGYELEASGEILEGWNVQAGYSHAKSTKSGIKQNTTIPEDQFKLFTTYNLPIWDKKLTIGGGVNWQSAFYSSSVSGTKYIAYKQDGYALVNLMAKYQLTPALSVALNVDNVTNEKYRLNYWAATYGDPTSYTASLSYKF
ncbi:TonB-dependent siderophore receptor [Acinetobacter sp. MB5]|uniref:TonB-dependent siderophore receptor n=1 Tax=Acinetobacter sp. MB5 TaxID=2069438 RepID=UPI000DD0724F|nr:TonB-dependent siderophore receptor [Acinetobacter sp. MB5]